MLVIAQLILTEKCGNNMKRFGTTNAGSTIVQYTVWVHFLVQSESLVVRPCCRFSSSQLFLYHFLIYKPFIFCAQVVNVWYKCTLSLMSFGQIVFQKIISFKLSKVENSKLVFRYKDYTELMYRENFSMLLWTQFVWQPISWKQDVSYIFVFILINSHFH